MENEITIARRRFAMLQELGGGECVECDIGFIRFLLESRGIGGTADAFEGDLEWLDYHNCVSVRKNDMGYIVAAEITLRGIACLKGEIDVPGVTRPKAEP
jgi:hypothetical protein